MTDKDYIEQYEEQTAGFFHGCFGTILLMVLFAAILFLCSCTTTRYVPVETVKTEYTNKTDTIIRHDSINNEKETIIREARPEDSLLIAKLGLQLRQNERLLILTQRELEKAQSETYKSHTDTVYREKEVKVPYPVEKKLTRWQRICLKTGKITLTVVGTLGVMGIIYAVWWLRRRKK